MPQKEFAQFSQEKIEKLAPGSNAIRGCHRRQAGLHV
jgi:hypothetical protein